jgi:hypothetical protein
LKFVLKPSPKLAAAIVAAHVAAASAVLLVLPSVAGALVAAGIVALGLSAAWSRALLRAGHSVRAIEVAGEAVTVELANGERLQGPLGDRRHVSLFLVTLPVARRTILVTADMLGRDLFRSLRIWALWGRLPAVAGKQLAA